jgi:uncharacterized protein (TIGR03435 family)
MAETNAHETTRSGFARAAACLLLVAIIVPRAGAVLHTQVPTVPLEQAVQWLSQAGPAFEVASIRANRSGDTGVRFGFQPGGRFNGVNVSLQTMIRNAYGVQSFEIVGGPAWLAVDRYDIVAKAPENAQPEQVRQMVRTLMADRFKLVLHRETRELPIYALVLARPDGRLGPQLKPSSTNCEEVARTLNSAGRGGAAPPAPPPQSGNRPTCGIRVNAGATAILIAGGTPIAQLASNLSGAVNRTVVDRTGLTGGFDIDLTFTPDPLMFQGAAPTDQPPGPSLFTALQEQLGLKIESTRGPVEVLVVDSAERPTEN